MKTGGIKGIEFLVVLVGFVFFLGSAQAQMFDHSGMMGKSSKKESQGHGKGDYGKKGYGGHPFDIERFKEKLKLSDEQYEKMKGVRSNYRKDMIKRKADLKIAEIELWELIDSEDLNIGKIEKKLKQVEGFKTEMMLSRIKTLGETKKVLSKEQYEKFRKMGFRSMSHRMGRHGMMDEMGSGHGGGMGMHPGGMMGGMHPK